MKIIDLASNISLSLKAEIDELEKRRREYCKRVDLAKSPSQYFNPFIKNVYGHEFVSRLTFPVNNQKLKILDIGFGGGETSLYLGHLGHTVYAIEPSPLFCETLDTLSKKFAIPIQIYQGIAEDIDSIPESGFDLCVFNSSLHHCDDPVKALKNCNKKLNQDGRVIAVNEPLLKFYRSKAWYQKKMHEDPVAIGHYGGNEHIYYYHQYVKLFKNAGLTTIKTFHHIRHKYPRETIRVDMDKAIQHEFVLSDKKIICKYFILLMLRKILKKNKGVIQGILKRLSLIPISFEATKGD